MKPKLPHTTKVKLRQALTALRGNDRRKETDEKRGGYRPLLFAQHEEAEKHILHKAGFQSRGQLEAFAKQHQLLKPELPFIDVAAHLELEQLP